MHQAAIAIPREGNALLTIKPWYETDVARRLLDLCVERRPDRLEAQNPLGEQAGLWVYDPADPIVAQIRAACEAYYECVAQVAPSLLSAARFDVRVEDAIDRAQADAELRRRMDARRAELEGEGLSIGEITRRMTAEFSA